MNKKTTTFALTILFFAQTITAETITITYGTSGNYYPYQGSTYDAFRIQWLYTQNEINQSGVIQKIYHQILWDDTNAEYNNLRIYLCHSDKTSLNSSFADNCKDAPVKVMDQASHTIAGDAGDWLEYDIDDTFTYNNINNLVIELRYNGDNGQNAPLMKGDVGTSHKRAYLKDDDSGSTAENTDRAAYNLKIIIDPSGIPAPEYPTSAALLLALFTSPAIAYLLIKK